ncbi:hypothetical protein GCM10027345_06470 [Hymenobacter daeguensis]
MRVTLGFSGAAFWARAFGLTLSSNSNNSTGQTANLTPQPPLLRRGGARRFCLNANIRLPPLLRRGGPGG